MIYILGAGSLGCLWAAHLDSRYKDAVAMLTTRAKAQSSISFDLERPTQHNQTTSHTIPLVHVDDVSSIDTLLVCTKSYDAGPALTDLQEKFTNDSQIVLFQNGLGSQFRILEALPHLDIFAAATTEGANRVSPEKVIHAGRGQTYIGPLNQSSAPKQDALKSLVDIDLTTHFEQDIWRRLWHKLAINCAINPFTALLNLPNGAIRSSDLFKRHWPELRSELVSMLDIAGHPIDQDNMDNMDKLIFEVMDKTKANISSMLQDIRFSKRTEIDDINGFAYQYLKRHEAKFDANHYLWKAVKDIEQTA